MLPLSIVLQSPAAELSYFAQRTPVFFCIYQTQTQTKTQTQTDTQTNTHTYTYIYIYAHTHTHTYIYKQRSSVTGLFIRPFIHRRLRAEYEYIYI